MATAATRARRLTSVSYHPASKAAERYRRARTEAIAPGLRAAPKLDLHNFGGRSIPALTFTNVYLGTWSPADRQHIDHALAAAMTDARLNGVIQQYFKKKVSATFAPSRKLQGPVPARVYKDTIEGFVAAMDARGDLASFDLSKTVVDFMLPKGVILVDGTKAGGHEESKLDMGDPDDEQVDSKHGLGGFHGSVHVPRAGGKTDTVYYAVGVYSQGSNGIVAFDQPWKNVVATFYHELQEARTDPDVEDADKTGEDAKLGWYSPKGGEIGDIPMDEAGADLSKVMKEVPLADGSGTVPIQLMWSNADHGPAAAR